MYRRLILDRAMSHKPEPCPWPESRSFDRTNSGVRNPHGLKANVDGSSGKLTDLLPLALFAEAPKYSLVRRYSSGDHAKSRLPRVALSQPP